MGAPSPAAETSVLPPPLEAALRAFEQIEPSAADTEPSLAAFVGLIEAIRPKRSEAPAQAVERNALAIARLEQDSRLAAAVRGHLQVLLANRSLVRFLADSGILPGTGFFSELGRILSHRLLPELPDPNDFSGCLQRIFYRPDDWVWQEQVPFEDTLRFWRALDRAPGAPFEQVVEHLTHQIIDAMLLLAYRIGALSTDEEFGRLGLRFARHIVRFQATAAAAQRFADALRRDLAEHRRPVEDAKELLVLLDQCHEALDDAHRIALRQGTSVRLTYQLRRSRQSLRRIELLIQLLDTGREAGGEDATLHAWVTLFREALRKGNQRNSPGRHIARGMEMLALRVTDNAAKTGEHYIAETGAEYLRMWRAAAGAGVVIAALALLKVFAGKADLAPAGYALLYSLNYGLGFVLIYMLHMTIATKQPAMTAQTIAGYLESSQQGRAAQLERVVDLVAAVARSQLAAILGNVLLALPVALAIGHGLSLLHGAPVIDTTKAAHLLHDLDPLGWAVPHAAIAGVFLFLSGLISGYFDNKASYVRIGERVAHLRWLRTAIGEPRAQRVGGYAEEHLGGLMGNFLFGCMLGSAGTIGMILGLPIDIRHIAFAAANLGYALQAYGFDLPWQTLAWSLLGVGLIGFTNLAVSFWLALWMSMKARGGEFTRTGQLLQRLWLRLKAQPMSFLLPPARPQADTRTAE
jgi:site-specific recombinase